MDEKRQLLRHMIATVMFRATVAIDGAPDDFADFRIAPDARSAGELLAHIGDLLTGSEYLLRGEMVELTSSPQAWENEKERFLESARKLDAFLAGDGQLAYPVENFVQGPIGDALTHVGQIVMLRRLAGIPIQPAPYFSAEITPGEFDNTLPHK